MLEGCVLVAGKGVTFFFGFFIWSDSEFFSGFDFLLLWNILVFFNLL
jgi:hypothetical protein